MSRADFAGRIRSYAERGSWTCLVRPALARKIAGGESGPRPRPMDPDWVRRIRDDCVRVNKPFFFKQWGGRTSKSGGRLLDGRTWDDLPDA